MHLTIERLRRWAALFGAAVLVLVFLWRLFPPLPAATPVDSRCFHSAFWLEHGWLGADTLFERQGGAERALRFENEARLAELADRLRAVGATHIYPHVGPIEPDGAIPRLDARRLKSLNRALAPIAIVPWIGGVLGKQAWPEERTWRARFVQSATDLMIELPEVSGIHLNIEPWPAGDTGLEALLSELRAVWPPGKILSLNVPAVSSPFGLAWSCALPEEELTRLSPYVDELVVSLYNTGAVTRRTYARTVAKCAERALLHSRGRRVWLALPAFPEEGGYHDETIENVASALPAALTAVASAAETSGGTAFAGFAVYAEWTAPAEVFRELGARTKACH